MIKYAIVALSVLIAACASNSTKMREAEALAEANQPEFDRGMRLLEIEDFSGAADIFDRLLLTKVGTEDDLITSYNSGVAHEGLGHCQKALDRYREVVRGSAGKFTRIEVQALFRSSLMYECLGQDKKALAALLDAKKRGPALPLEIERAELPARLAATYSRLGNRPKALEYFNQANTGLKAILASGPTNRKQKEVLARTLYFMGKLNPAQRTADADPMGFLQSLSMQQPYLLQAIEIGNPVWSRKAQEDLTTAYDNMLRYSLKDRELRRQFFVRAQQVMAELRRIRMPNAGPMEDSVFDQVDKTARHLQIQMADAAEAMPLTPEAAKRQGLRRQGKLEDPKAAPVRKRIKN